MLTRSQHELRDLVNVFARKLGFFSSKADQVDLLLHSPLASGRLGEEGSTAESSCPFIKQIKICFLLLFSCLFFFPALEKSTCRNRAEQGESTDGSPQ